MQPSADPNTIYQLLLVILALANGLGALGTFIQAVKGRPSVKREEYDEHKSQIHARLGGLNDKINTSFEKLESKQDEVLREMRGLVESIARHEGLLERSRDGGR